eukprot:8836272-Ditylum_brightwellii.AAC.1
MENTRDTTLDGIGKEVVWSVGQKGKEYRTSFVPTLGPPEEAGRKRTSKGSRKLGRDIMKSHPLVWLLSVSCTHHDARPDTSPFDTLLLC